MNEDSDMTARFDRWLRFVVAGASLALALSFALAWAGNVALDQALESGDADSAILTMSILGWAELAFTVVAVAGLVVGVWRHQMFWARGVLAVVVGIALHWIWWLVDRRFDIFGVGGLKSDDPVLLAKLELRLWITLGIDVLAVAALVLGGVLLLWPDLLRRTGRRALAPADESEVDEPDADDEPGSTAGEQVEDEPDEDKPAGPPGDSPPEAAPARLIPWPAPTNPEVEAASAETDHHLSENPPARLIAWNSPTGSEGQPEVRPEDSPGARLISWKSAAAPDGGTERRGEHDDQVGGPQP